MIINSAAEFGALVRSERKKRRWSQEELATRVGVSPLWISQFERGKSSAQIGLVMRTLKALGIKLWAGDAPGNMGRATVIDLDALVSLPPEASLLNEEAESYSRSDE